MIEKHHSFEMFLLKSVGIRSGYSMLRPLRFLIKHIEIAFSSVGLTWPDLTWPSEDYLNKTSEISLLNMFMDSRR